MYGLYIILSYPVEMYQTQPFNRHLGRRLKLKKLHSSEELVGFAERAAVLAYYVYIKMFIKYVVFILLPLSIFIVICWSIPMVIPVTYNGHSSGLAPSNRPRPTKADARHTLIDRGDQHVKTTQYRLKSDLQMSLQFHVSSSLGCEYELLSMRTRLESDYASDTVWYLLT
jgi:hypothetical protein